MTRGSSREWSNHGKSLVSPRTMLNNDEQWLKCPEQAEQWWKYPEQTEQWWKYPEQAEQWWKYPEQAEQWWKHPEQCWTRRGVGRFLVVMAWGLWGMCQGSWGFVVMVTTGSWLVWVESPGCDGVGLWWWRGVVVIFLSLLMVTTGSWVVEHAMEFLLTLKRGFTFYDNFSVSIRANAINPHSATRYWRTSDNTDNNDRNKCRDCHRYQYSGF